MYIQIIRSALLVLILFISQDLLAQNWPGGIHDPTNIIKEGDTYWIFGTGDGIGARYSYDMVTWYNGPTPFRNGNFPEWILNYAKSPYGCNPPNCDELFNGGFWAPDIIFMNNQYYLYYSASIWGTTFSTIGLVTNKTLDPNSPDYEWVDQGDLGIFSPRSGWQINAIDPAMMRGPDGRIWMTYGSFNLDGIMVTELDSVSGKPIGQTVSVANSWTGGNRYGEGEGGYMFYRDGYYYMVYNKGGCCAGIASSYYMVIGRSESPTGPFVDKEGKNMRVVNAPSGGTVIFRHDDSRGLDDRYYGPGHFGLYSEGGVDYVSFHYYNPNGFYPNEAANNMGGPTIGHAMLEWGEDGWPSISFDFLPEGVYTLTNSKSEKMLDLQNQSLESGTFPFQYDADSTSDTQKWYFKPLGTGEYTISSWADTTKYLELAGPDYDQLVKLTDNYTGAVNQKWRLVKDINGKLIIYPSRRDAILDVLYSSVEDFRVHVEPNDNDESQRWYASLVYGLPAQLSVSTEEVKFKANGTAEDTLKIHSNTLWDITVGETSWLTVSSLSGERDSEVAITVSENTTASERSSVLSIKPRLGSSKLVFITQAAAEPEAPVLSEQRIALNISPNPSDGWVNISSPEPVRVEVFNLSGKQVASFMELSLEKRLDLSHLPKGVYLFQITAQDKKWTQKFIRN